MPRTSLDFLCPPAIFIGRVSAPETERIESSCSASRGAEAFAAMAGEMKFMREAIKLAHFGVEQNYGGPFGCVVVREGEIVGRGWNQVTSTNDPTAHAEVVAIRDACARLGTFQLSGCDLYTSCEPCPMCLGAIYWARPQRIFFANTRHDAAEIGFDDTLIYEELALDVSRRRIPMINLGREEALASFGSWAGKQDRILY